MYIIPAIDVLDKKLVRLCEGNYNEKTVYDINLDEMLKKYISAGTNFIHIIDLNGAKGETTNQQFIIDTVKKYDIHVQYGGGVRSIQKVKELLDMGFQRIIVGTQAIIDPSFLETLSPQYTEQIIIAIDVLDEVIKYSGWLESSPIKLFDYIDKCVSLGFNRFLCTDISKDGKLAGTSIDLYKKILAHNPSIKLIASGGVSSMKDIEAADEISCESIVVGKAIYEEKITVEEVNEWNNSTPKSPKGDFIKGI